MDEWKKGEILDSFSENLRIQAELDQGLTEKKEKQAWLESYRRRADRLEQLFQQNQAMASTLQDILQEPMTAEAADFLYTKLLRKRKGSEPNGRIAMPILLLLIPYYEQHNDAEKLVRLYSYVYAVMSSVSLRTQENAPIPKTVYSRKIIALRDQYDKIRDERSRVEIFTAYYTICVEERSQGLVSVDESYRFLQEMLELWHSPTVQRLDGGSQHISWYVSLAQHDWLAAESDIDQAAQEVKAYFCRTAKRCYQEELAQCEELWQCGYFTTAAALHAQVIEGTMTWDQALRRMLSYYTQCLAHPLDSDDLSPQEEHIGQASVEEADFLLDVPPILERWLHHCSDPALREEVVKRLKEDTCSVLYQKFAGATEPSIISSLAKWCFKMMPYFQTREEKEEWLYNLVVRKQLPTYLHAGMVEKLAHAVTAGLLRDQPELFQPIRELVQGQDMLEYISKCALFHDIGKNEIADVINTQVRSLEDDEYAAIRRHPEYGCDLIGDDPDFRRYHDVILGHHKFYNGKGGYPESFDNTASPYRFVIDIITVCDCIDAATDTLGRNYKRAKTIEQVLAEFQQDKGIRYNPQIIDYLQSSPELQAQLRQLVVEERGETAYEIYSEALSV